MRVASLTTVASLLCGAVAAGPARGAGPPVCAVGASEPPLVELPTGGAISRRILENEAKLMSKASSLLLVQKGASLAEAEAAASARAADTPDAPRPALADVEQQRQQPMQQQRQQQQHEALAGDSSVSDGTPSSVAMARVFEASVPANGIASVVMSADKADSMPLRHEKGLVNDPAVGAAITAAADTDVLSSAALAGRRAPAPRDPGAAGKFGDETQRPRQTSRWPEHSAAPAPDAAAAALVAKANATATRGQQQPHHLNMSVSSLNPVKGLEARKPYQEFAKQVKPGTTAPGTSLFGEEKIAVTTNSPDTGEKTLLEVQEEQAQAGFEGQNPAEWFADDSSQPIADRFRDDGLGANTVQRREEESQWLAFCKLAFVVLGPLILVGAFLMGVVRLLAMARTRGC